jgi:hypothetical protein
MNIKDIILEETENVISFNQRKKEISQKVRIKKIILDSIESHAISLIASIPDYQIEQIKKGMAKHGTAFLERLLDYMYTKADDNKSGFRMLKHLKQIHPKEFQPSHDEEMDAFAVGVKSAIEDYFPEPEPKEPYLKLVEDEVDEKLELKPGKLGWTKYAELVGKAYMDAPMFEPEAVASYRAMIPFVERMFKQIESRVKIEFVNFHPYESAEELRKDVEETGVLRISTADSDHPVFTNEENAKFRAIHDYMSHIQGIGSRGTEFSLRGEIAAYNIHLKTIPKAAIPALFTEVIGQVCAYYYLGGKFPEKQKIAILPGFDYINVGKVEGMDIKDKELNEDELEEISLDKDIGGHHDPDDESWSRIRSRIDPKFTTEDIERILHWKNKNDQDQYIRNNLGIRIDGDIYKFDIRSDLFYTGVKTMGNPCCVIARRSGDRQFVWYTKNFDRVIMKINTYKPNQMDKGNPNVAVVEWSNAAEDMRGKGFAYACYKTLAVDLNLILMSDTTQSEGSAGVWKRFIKDPDLVATVEYKSDRNEKMYSSVVIDKEGEVDSDIGDPWQDPQELTYYKEQVYGPPPDMMAFNKAGSYIQNPKYVEWRSAVDGDENLQKQIAYLRAAQKSKIYIYGKGYSKSKKMVPDFSQF